MKRYVCLFAVILLLVGCSQTQIRPKSNGEYEYKIVDGSVTIVKYIGDASEVEIPAEIDGYPVKVIGEGAFSLCYSVNKLKKLPDGIEVIEDGAFDILYLRDIYIPDSVITIGEYAFGSNRRSLNILYDNNPLVPQYAQENDILCFKNDEYNPVLTVELVGGKPLNDDKNLGISQDDYNHVGRRSICDNEIYDWKDFSYITLFGHDLLNEFNGFTEYEDLSQEEIEQKLIYLSVLLYGCGITEYDPETINTGEVGCFDKLITAAIYCKGDSIFDEIINGKDLAFADDEFLFVEVYGLFDFFPDPSLITGYSEQQHGIWYYSSDIDDLEGFNSDGFNVISFDGNLDDGNYVMKLAYIDNSGQSCERTYNFLLMPYLNGDTNYCRIIIKSIK